MSRETFIVLRIVFSLLILAGLVVGFSSTSADNVYCGAYFDPEASQSEQIEDTIDQLDTFNEGGGITPITDFSACNEKLGTRGTITWILMLVGLAGNLTCFALKPKKLKAAAASTSGTAGWYPDPNDARWLAYWDGENWVETEKRYPNAPK